MPRFRVFGMVRGFNFDTSPRPLPIRPTNAEREKFVGRFPRVVALLQP